MRKVILGVSVSLDGRIARANGGVDFLRTPKEHPIGALDDVHDLSSALTFPVGVSEYRSKTGHPRTSDCL